MDTSATTQGEEKSGEPMAMAKSLLEIESLSAGYDESIILNQIDLQIPQNQVVALLGRN